MSKSHYYTNVVASIDATKVVADTGHVIKRISTIHAVDSYASLQIKDGLEALVMVLQTHTLNGISEWPESSGCTIVIDTIPNEPSKSRITLQLLNTRYRIVFRSFCDDICSVLALSQNPEEAVRVFHRRLLKWISFLKQRGPDGLSPESQCGLYGELLVLRDVLLPHLDPSVLVPAWRGCKKAQQDFQFRDYAIEVKTTRATIPDRISISSVQQLDTEGIESMVLTLVHVHANESTGESLPGIVADLAGQLPDDTCDLLTAGLQEVGYDNADREIYEKTLYQLLQRKHYEVVDGFPRITREQLADGIRKVRYEVGIDACKSFEIEESEVLKRLEMRQV